MDSGEYEFPLPPSTLFRLFTKESITKIRRKAEETRLAKELLISKEKGDEEATPPASWLNCGDCFNKPTTSTPTADEEDGYGPNPVLEAGRHLPSKMGEFPPELYGKPIEDLDEFYQDKFVSTCKIC